MEFEWDEAKSDACLDHRGFDFAFAAGVFADPTLLVEVDDRRDYGEPRLVAVGRIAEFHFTVVFTPRAAKVRIISARRASRKEIARYGSGQRPADA
ncbi:MAG: BrnT family toxin [Geminicoccaceae bacterium]